MDNDRTKARRGGRPPKSVLDRRDTPLHFRVRPDELAAIEERAASSNLYLSEFLREQAMFGAIMVRQSRTLSAIDRHDLARIGSNLNQIARACNTAGDSVAARHIEALLDELRGVLRRIDSNPGGSDELGQG